MEVPNVQPSMVPISPDRVALHERHYRSVQRAKRGQALLGFVVLVLVALVAARVGEVDIGKLLRNIWRFPAYIVEIMPTLRWGSLAADLAEWYWGIGYWLRKLGETLLIAYVGTILGFVGGFSLCFLAAQNVTPASWVLFVARRYLEFCRTVPELVFALIFVIAFGLGPVPGVLAIAIHTTGALGKQFYEVVENIDMNPLDGVKAAGASWIEIMRFAALPQVISNFASYALLRFEINVRGAAIMGFVGAGGIGQDLLEAVRKFYYSDVSAMLLLIVVTVMIIDMATERLRHYLIGLERRA